MQKKILLMYISDNSGHHKACLAIEKAFRLKHGNDVATKCVNSFNYTNPILEKIIGTTYMGVINRKPEFWGYLYDNPAIVRKAQRIRELIHKYNTEKLKTLLESYSPDAVICTQAFPCGMVADYKKTFNTQTPLFGVLTDYSPHSYWVFDKVNAYFVPSFETGQKLIKNGVPENKIIETGLPIDPVFMNVEDKSRIMDKLGLSEDMPVILLMGGSQGIGPLKEAYASLLKMRSDIQIVVIAGKNGGIYRWFKRQERKFTHGRSKLRTYLYVDNVDEIMEASTILISKPGGITTAEACAKGLPLLIIKPIPGQEMMNSEYLLKNNVALKVDNPHNVGVMVSELLYNRGKLEELSARARTFSKPESALNIASLTLANI